jgi:hypothetical protein
VVTAAVPPLSFACTECGATLSFGNSRSTICPYCRCPSVVERPASPDRPNPALVVPFGITEAAAHQAIRSWLVRRRFFHRSLDRATLSGLQGIYVPAYLYSAIVETTYTAQIGENYTVTETYTTTENGKTVTRTRQVTKTEWRPLSGTHAAYATDHLVTASLGLPNRELQEIEPFDLRALRRFSPALVSGWQAEEPSRPVATGTELGRREALDQTAFRLRAFMPGDRFSDLSFQSTFRDETVDLALLPVWVVAVRPDPAKPALRVLVNGQTSEVWGPESISALKVILWVAAAIVLGVIAFLVFKGAPR